MSAQAGLFRIVINSASFNSGKSSGMDEKMYDHSTNNRLLKIPLQSVDIDIYCDTYKNPLTISD